MLNFYIITIFPKIFESYFQHSIIKRAQKNKSVVINIINLRDYATDKHKTVDDTPYGGGAGMIMKVEPIYKAVKNIKSNLPTDSKTLIWLFSAKGKKYTQRKAEKLIDYDNIILICGRYEGIDERVAQYIADEEISIGDYVLTGGEIPAMVVVDSVSRLLPGVLGNPHSLKEESFGKNIYSEYPQYTKPAQFKDWKVPSVLLSGHHQEIKEWRRKQSFKK